MNRLPLSGGSVSKLANHVKAKLGGIAAAQLLDLNVQSDKLRENFGMLFSGLKIDGYLKAFKTLTDLFSQSTVTGKALKQLMSTVFNPMLSVIEYLAPVAESLFQGMVIAAQELIIVVLKAGLFLKKAFDLKSTKGIDLTSAALTAGKVAVYGIAAALTALVPIAISLGVYLASALTPIIIAGATALWGFVAAGAAMAAPFILGGLAIAGLIATGYQLYRLWKEIDWKGLGGWIVDGIVDGLTSKFKLVKEALRGLADLAMDSFKSALGIHSPSKAFANLGVQLPRGVEKGIQVGKPQLDDSVDDMISLPAAHAAVPEFSSMFPSTSGSQGSGAAPATSSAPASTGSSRSITFGDIIINTNATDGKGTAIDVRKVLEEFFRTMATETGAA